MVQLVISKFLLHETVIVPYVLLTAPYHINIRAPTATVSVLPEISTTELPQTERPAPTEDSANHHPGAERIVTTGDAQANRVIVLSRALKI